MLHIKCIDAAATFKKTAFKTFNARGQCLRKTILDAIDKSENNGDSKENPINVVASEYVFGAIVTYFRLFEDEPIAAVYKASVDIINSDPTMIIPKNYCDWITAYLDKCPSIIMRTNGQPIPKYLMKKNQIDALAELYQATVTLKMDFASNVLLDYIAVIVKQINMFDLHHVPESAIESVSEDKIVDWLNMVSDNYQEQHEHDDSSGDEEVSD